MKPLESNFRLPEMNTYLMGFIEISTWLSKVTEMYSLRLGECLS